jgi:hypothetical protein
MVEPAPKIDKRTAEDVAKQVQLLLAQYLPEEFREPPQTGISAALVKIFARFSEIVIQRLNQVPDKNFLAFLDLLGASRLPPQPARVPLTFSLAAGSAVDAIVPAGTQVAAPPAEGQSEPVIFETERELVVTAAELVSIFTRDPLQDKYGDKSAIAQSTSSLDVPVFQGESAIAHILYIAHDTLLGYPDLQNLTLQFELKQIIEKPDTRSLQWEIWDGKNGILIQPSSSGVAGLSQPRVADNTEGFTKNGTVVFNDLPQVPQQTVFGITSRWLRCRLQTPITKTTEKQDGRVRAPQLPSISKVTLQATLGKSGQAIKQAFTNQLPVDLSKPFFPFGEKPKFGDTLYLANREAFSKSGAKVTLKVDLADLAALGLALPNAVEKPSPTLQWEVWSKQGWRLVGTSTHEGPIADLFPPSITFQDTTKAFTITGSGQVSFILPEQLEATTVNGIESFWIRVRIVSGNYGEEAKYVKDDKQTAGYRFDPPTFKPPLINSIKVDYTLTLSDQKPDQILTYNDFSYQKFAPDSTFKPFEAIADNRPTLYLGFSLPATRNTFPNRTLTLFFRLADVVYNPNLKHEQSSSTSPPRLVWQYWSGSSKKWETLTVRDETEVFTRPGLVEFLPPTDFAAKSDFGLDKERYWLRVQWEGGDYSIEPRLQRVLLNTTMAAQTVTIRNEVLGSSDGSENQKFRLTQAPVLKGQNLEVQEPELPAAEEQKRLKQVEGEEAIAIAPDASGRPQEIWVRWHEVADFYGSGSRDRHYVLDRLTGEIQFGNGLNGLIPPVGTGNLRMAYYQTGGGTAGNKPAGTIVQLKTTVPYVDKVTNTEAAAGGADAESLESLRDREPRKLRHNNRAVTLEDYEDLARLASPDVARAKCIPLLDLSKNDGLDVQNPPGQTPKAPGQVGVIIVPRSTEAKPLPSLELIRRVQDYLEAHCLPTVTISVVGPLYISVSVTAEIAVTSPEGASAVKQSVEQKLASFLHPLTGGLDGKGWDFGREPHKSDFYALLEAIPGVNYVRTLNVSPPPYPVGVRETGRFLVYSGNHEINLVF